MKNTYFRPFSVIYQPLAVLVGLYVAILLTITCVTGAKHFWTGLFTTPRAQSGFILYSLAYALPSFFFLAFYMLHGGGNISRVRIGGIILGLLGMSISGFFLVIFVLAWDWKMQI
jgi:hypothetical protein